MTEINNLPDKEFKALVIRMVTELWKRIDYHTKNFNKKVKNIFLKRSRKGWRI